MFEKNAFVRDRILTTPITISILISSIVNRNAKGYSRLIEDFFSNPILNPYNLKKTSKSAFCNARKKIPYEILKKINEELLIKSNIEENFKWKGYNVYAVDGTKITLPATKDFVKRFKKFKANKAYLPQATLLTVYNIFSNCIKNSSCSYNRASEKKLFTNLLNDLPDNSVYVLDRLYDSFKLFQTLSDQNKYFLTRIKNNRKIVKAFLKSSDKNKIIEVSVNDKILKLRLLKGGLDRTGKRIIFATNLLNKKKFRRIELIQLYKTRWNVETFYNRFKNSLKFEKFHSKDFNGFMQELYSHFIYFNIGSGIVNKCKFINKRNKKINFSYEMALDKIGIHICSILILKKNNNILIRKLFIEAVQSVLRTKNKIRENRSYPRFSKQPQNRWNHTYARRAAKAHFRLK